ncbi:MAG: alpha/beta hydrolase-fold protein [Planctomycetota bacterium]|nr:alpha/beta hydrolase-fold protein [Planctomycetota bacterium]
MNWINTRFGAFCALSLVASSTQAQWTTPPISAPRLQYRTFQSAAAGAIVSYHIYTPPAYDTQPERRFPVLYWLHGSGSPTAGIAPMTNWFASAIARGDLGPIIVVFPNGMPYGMYCDAADGSRAIESVIMQELVPHVDATFRTVSTRNARIIEGFSMGGYGAGRLGFKHTNLFGAVSLLGAGPVQTDFMDAPEGSNIPPERRTEIFEDVWNSDPTLFYAASPWALAEGNAQAIITSGVQLRIMVGEDDSMLAPNADLHLHLLSLGIPHSYRTYSGVRHDTLSLLRAMGADNWDFYRRALAPRCDFNADGTRDFFDYLDFATAFASDAADADVNHDGLVDFFDYLDFASAFGGC